MDISLPTSDWLSAGCAARPPCRDKWRPCTRTGPQAEVPRTFTPSLGALPLSQASPTQQLCKCTEEGEEKPCQGRVPLCRVPTVVPERGVLLLGLWLHGLLGRLAHGEGEGAAYVLGVAQLVQVLPEDLGAV